MSLNTTLWAPGEGQYFFKCILCIPFHIWNYMSKHMAGFLTLDDGNKPSAPGSQHQNQRFPAILFFCLSFILLSTDFICVSLYLTFCNISQWSKVNITLRQQEQKQKRNERGCKQPKKVHFHCLSLRIEAKIKL